MEISCLTKDAQKSVLIVVFSLSLITSHYGTAFIFVLALLVAFIFKNVICVYFKVYNGDYISHYKDNITLLYIAFFLCVTIIWYIYISNAYTLEILTKILKSVLSTFSDSLFDSDSSRGMHMIVNTKNSGINMVSKILNLCVPLLAVIGFCWEMYHIRQSKFSKEYLGLSLLFFLLLGGTIAVSYLAVMSSTRIFILALPLLAPLCIIGGLLISKVFLKLFHLKSHNIIFVLYLFFGILFLFNIQFFNVLIGDHPTSISLGQDYILKEGNFNDKAIFYSSIISEYDIKGLEWISSYKDGTMKLLFTGGQTQLGSFIESSGYFEPWNVENLDPTTFNNKNGYMMLIYANLQENIAYLRNRALSITEYASFNETFPNMDYHNNLFYNNGGNKLYL
jgi:uncharacterized membrane protein